MFLSAGHSDSDPGAVGNGRKEADVAVDCRNMVSLYLTQAGRQHTIDGVGKINMPLNDAVKIAKKHKTAVEFHCNASANATATGVEVLCAPKDNKTAGLICEAVSESLGIRNRGVKAEGSGQHHRLAFVQAGGMIVELFFISNRDDVRAWDARKRLAAKAIADVLKSAP